MIDLISQECKRSGQIPAFGNWDYANELPITQYFETARQAGLVRYSSSSGESDPYVRPHRDLYAVDLKKPLRNMPPSTVKKVPFSFPILPNFYHSIQPPQQSLLTVVFSP